MSKIMYYLRNINTQDISSFFWAIVSFGPGFILGCVKRDIWIVSERKDEAKDNGYCFFKHVCMNASRREVYYAINTKSKDYEKVKELGNVIEFGSFKHYIYTWAANKYISSQYSNGMPSRFMFYCWLWGVLRTHFCFLQHGVTQNKSHYLELPAKRVSFVSCVCDKEAEFMHSMGYSGSSALVTGFCRFDDLNSKHNKQVFIMFTWRNYLTDLSNEEFRQTMYYKVLKELINCDIWKTTYSDSKVVVKLHPGMKKFGADFSSEIDNVEIDDNDKYTFQELISNSSLFITDFSSVTFDFAYLNREVCYLQFDTEEFREKHLQQGYFDYNEDGFGPVFSNVGDMCSYITHHKYEQEKIYNQRSSAFFKYYDKNNCQRNYDVIESIK